MTTQFEQGCEVLQAPQDTKILGVVEYHLRTQSTPIFQVLFESAVFVTNADDGLNAFSKNPGVELTSTSWQKSSGV